MAHLHARAVTAHPRAVLVGVSDLDRRRAEEFSATWNDLPVFESFEELLRAPKLDLVLICTPPAAHHSQTIAALASGFHVVVEKPPASSLVELDDMRMAAAAAERELAVVFQQRTGTAASHFRELIRSGALGRPLVATCHTLWFRKQDYFDVPWRGRWATEGGGTTLGHGIHQIDLLAFLLGDWATVRGSLWRTDRDTQTEDVSTATVTFRSGAVASVVNSAVSPREISSIRIDTQKATITVDHVSGHGHENWSITPAPGVDEAEAARWALPAHEERSDHGPLLRDVFDALLDGRELPPTSSDPARSFEIVAAIYASAAADGAVITPELLATHPTHRRGFASPVNEMRPL